MCNLVSIIMPSYNSKETILDSVLSVQLQSFRNWELLITDDCSTDGTWEILNAMAQQDPRIKIFRNEINCGAAVSRNNSISKASGEFIAFLDSDDLWEPEKLNEQLDIMIKGVDFTFTAYQLINDKGELLNITVDTLQNKPLNYHDMLKKKATLGCSTVILRKNAFADLSMPLIRTGQDYALWLKLLKTGTSAWPLNKILTRYRILPNSISRNKIKKAKRQWEIYRRIECLPFMFSIWCYIFYAWRAIYRK